MDVTSATHALAHGLRRLALRFDGAVFDPDQAADVVDDVESTVALFGEIVSHPAVVLVDYEVRAIPLSGGAYGIAVVGLSALGDELAKRWGSFLDDEGLLAQVAA